MLGTKEHKGAACRGLTASTCVSSSRKLSSPSSAKISDTFFCVSCSISVSAGVQNERARTVSVRGAGQAPAWPAHHSRQQGTSQAALRHVAKPCRIAVRCCASAPVSKKQ